jgi:uncharacterized protein YbaR (Trm112 family)
MQRAQLEKAMLRLLACPVCRAGLQAPAVDAVRCTGCGRHYPVRDGLPVLIAEAAIEPRGGD